MKIDSKTISHEVLTQFACDVLAKTKMSKEDARTLSEILVEADLRGVHTHGLNIFPRYVRSFQQGIINPTPNTRVIRGEHAVSVIDADNGIGHVATHFATNKAAENAEKYGIGMATVTNSNHFGAAAYYATRLAERGMIGYVVTNTPPMLTAFGGISPVLGNNPIAYAIPTKTDPIVLDMALSPVAMGKLRMMAQEDEKIPDGWAIDKEGKPTNDANKALAGFTLPIAGHKGYGMSFINEIMSGALSGSKVSTEIPRGGFSTASPDVIDRFHVGHTVVAMRVSSLIDEEVFFERVQTLTNIVRDSKKADSVDRIYVPGEIEYEKLHDRVKNGIPLSKDIVEKLVRIGTEVGVPFPN